ncbi:hypothetical protein [Nocardioides yefusunii]|uniref:DUF2238 domain-containing protein n=1 Tax=Nocardioides yefusunii TaxID=2500546 RepID=A0ABW1QUM6_9ACTN|nr:hypothetical protein [Nocardioides yefusunii]
MTLLSHGTTAFSGSLRWPDAVRGVAAGSVPVAASTDGFVGAALLLLVLGGCMAPVLLGAPAEFDVALCSVMLSAAWAALLDAYVTVPWLDLAVHGVLTGLLAATVGLTVVHYGLLAPDLPAPLRRTALGLLTFLAGLALATVWELGEWWGHEVVDARIQVGYRDTMSDLALGALGAAVAGVVVAARLRSPLTHPNGSDL